MVVVVFRTRPRPDVDAAELMRAAERMYATASQVPGFLSFQECTSTDGDAFALVRFESAETLAAWRDHPEHVETQRRGREQFFDSYAVEVCEVVRAYEWQRGE